MHLEIIRLLAPLLIKKKSNSFINVCNYKFKFIHWESPNMIYTTLFVYSIMYACIIYYINLLIKLGYNKSNQRYYSRYLS